MDVTTDGVLRHARLFAVRTGLAQAPKGGMAAIGRGVTTDGVLRHARLFAVRTGLAQAPLLHPLRIENVEKKVYCADIGALTAYISGMR